MKFRRTIAGFLAVATVATASNVFASATTNTVGATVGNATAAVGGTFSIDISLSDIPTTGISATDFAINFDSKAVTITSVTEGAICNTGAAAKELELDSSLADSMMNGGTYSCFDWYTQTNGNIAVMWATALDDSTYWIKKSGVFATIKGTVNSTVAEGTKIPFTIAPVDRATYPGSTTTNTDVNFGYTDATDKVVAYASTLTAGTLTVSGASTVLSGDVTGDGKIDISDVVEFCKVIGKGKKFTDPKILANADCVADGVIDMKDALAVLQFVTKYVTALPIK